MQAPFWRVNLPSIVIGLMDVFAIGFGMGVPIFAILLGVPVGSWLATRQLREERLAPGDDIPTSALRHVLLQAGALTTVTFLVLLATWGLQLSAVFDPAVTAHDWGIPEILYTSQASKVGWMVLMLVISPLLQGMTVLATAMAVFATARRKTS